MKEATVAQHDHGPVETRPSAVVVDEVKGMVWLLFTRNNDQVGVTSSGDDGRTWDKPRDITSAVKRTDWTWYATGPGNGIQLARGKHKGRLVIPCDHRVKGVADRRESSRSGSN